MEKCRICFLKRKNLRSVFDSSDGITFAYMMSSLANIKIYKEDGITDQICGTCCTNLKQAYDFKLQIKRSDDLLQSTQNFKKIHFDSVADIKMKIEILEQVDDNHILENNFDDYFKQGEVKLCYKDTIITRLEPLIKNENESLSVYEFLNSIQDDSVYDNNDEYDMDPDYMPNSNSENDNKYSIPLSKRRKQHLRKKISDKRKDPNLKPVHIIPVFLDNIRVTRNKENFNNQPKVKKKYVYRKKQDMCNICGKMSTCIQKHLLLHTGKRSHVCIECGKGFLTEGDLQKHSHRHTKKKDFKCEHCIAAFHNKPALQSHMLMHSEERAQVCDICNKKFKRRSALHRHKMMHNVANKRVKCDLCNMSFFTKYNLNHHLRVHTGERPYNCEICSQPYSYKHDFNRHCFKKHGVFLKRRSVNVMNEEILKRERELMKDLMVQMRSFGEEKPLNPFDGPQAALAFEQAIKVLQSKQMPIDLQ